MQTITATLVVGCICRNAVCRTHHQNLEAAEITLPPKPELPAGRRQKERVRVCNLCFLGNWAICLVLSYCFYRWSAHSGNNNKKNSADHTLYAPDSKICRRWLLRLKSKFIYNEGKTVKPRYCLCRTSTNSLFSPHIVEMPSKQY